MMVFAIIFSFCNPLFASNGFEKDKDIPASQITRGANIGIIQDVPSIIDIIGEENQTSGATEVSIKLVRNGNSTTCQAYLEWSGTQVFQTWRFKKISITNTSILSPTVYGTFGNGTTYTTYEVVGAPVGSLFIGNVTVPTNVTQFRSSANSLQGYKWEGNIWLSAAPISTTGTIN
jgi:hypothetical protein